MPAITTHVLDTSIGRPVAGVPVSLEVLRDRLWVSMGQGETNEDGRLKLVEAASLATYRLTFTFGTEVFYPEIVICFVMRDERHHHIPLLLNPFGYSTYRGS